MYTRPSHINDVPSAIDALVNSAQQTDAVIAKSVGILRTNGYTSKQVREIVGEKNYVISHLKRVGLNLSQEALELWHSNPKRITLGHTRAIAYLPPQKQEELCRNLLVKHITVRQLEQLANKKIDNVDDDMGRYLAQLQEKISETIGRPVSITTKGNGKSGSLTLDWFDFEDFDHICKQLGFELEE